MSCRAFSRRIEHQCLELLFDRFGVSEIAFEFEATPRNGPLRDFFAGLLGRPPEEGLRLTRAQFEANRPAFYFQIKEPIHG
jgi:predicted enzyme involved in methoxymalonyl-ACP biosynthesis